MVITSSRAVSLPFIPNIERVETFELLGVIVSNDLKWNSHIAYVMHKANSRRHLLRQLKRAEVPQDDILHFYISIIRPVLEYVVAVWHTGLTADLSDKLSHTKTRTSYNIRWLQFY